MFKPLHNGTDHGFIFPRQCNFLKFLGLWPLDKAEPDLNLHGYLYRILCIWTIILVFFICLAQALFITHNLTDILSVTEGGCTVFMGLHNLIRLVHLFIQRAEFKNVIDAFARDIWISPVENPKVYKICQRESIVIRVISISLLLLIGMYVIFPIVDILMHPDMQIKPFPYKMWFPFETQSPLIYSLTYVLSSWAGFCVVTTLLSEDSIFCYFIINTCGRFRILHETILNLENNAEKVIKEKGMESSHEALVDNIKSEMKNAIYKHNVLIGFCLKLEELFSPILLVNFMISSLLICMVGFQIASVKMSMVNLVKLIVYIMSALNQLLILCWYGDKLIHHSIDIGDALYFCGWQRWRTPTVTKMLILPLMRSRHAVRITALKFSVLSLPSFGAILSTSMSYFTLLRTLIETEEPE